MPDILKSEVSYPAVDLFNSITGLALSLGNFILFGILVLALTTILWLAYRRFKAGETIGSVLLKRADKNNRTFREGFTPNKVDRNTDINALRSEATVIQGRVTEIATQAKTELAALEAAASDSIKAGIPTLLAKARNVLDSTSLATLNGLTDPVVPEDQIPPMPNTPTDLAVMASIRARAILAIGKLDTAAGLISSSTEAAVTLLSAKVAMVPDEEVWRAGYDGSSTDPSKVTPVGYVRVCRKVINDAKLAGKLDLSAGMSYVVETALVAMI